MLPSFSYVIEGVLAGMGWPGEDEALRANLELLKARGIGAVVSLTPTPIDAAACRAADLQLAHLPVHDFMPPSLRQVRAFVAFVETMERLGKGVVVHCWAGIGRTGTMLACGLVARARAADEAIAEVRQTRPGSLETGDQEQLVHRYAASLRTRGES